MRGGLAAHPVAIAAPTETPLWKRVDPFRAAVCLILLISVARLHDYFTVLQIARPALLGTSLALVYAFLNPRALVKEPLFRTWPPKVFAMLLVMACISAPFGLSLGGSMAYVLNVYSRVLIFGFLLIAAIRDVRDLRLFAWCYLIGTAVMCYFSIFVLDVVEMAGSAVARLSHEGAMYDANDLGVLITISIPLSVMVFQTSRWPGKVFCGIVLMMGAATLALTGSRGGLLGFLTVGIALLVAASHVSVPKRLAIVVVATLALVFAAPSGYWTQMKSMLNTDDYNYHSEDGRLQIWSRGAGYLFRYPLHGVGINNFGRAEGTISDKARRHEPGTGIMYTAAHNTFVQVGAELGLPGLVLFSSLIVGAFVSMRRLRRRMPRAWISGTPDERFLWLATTYFPIAFVGFAITASFVSFAFASPIYMLAAFVSGALISFRQMRPPGTVQTDSPRTARGRRGSRPV